MLNACSSVPAAAKDAYLVYKIALLQGIVFAGCKDNYANNLTPSMRSYIFTAAIVISIIQQKCQKNAMSTVPACIQSKIDVIKKEPRWNPPAKVEEYRYGGRR